jgi:hypothetical protein
MRQVQDKGFDMTPKGFISVPSNKWSDLLEDHRTFVQTYNANVKHNDSVKELIAPDGVIFQNKARQIDAIEQMEETLNEKEDKTSKKKKKIRLHLKQSKNPDGNRR